jgi:hypothetical protein
MLFSHSSIKNAIDTWDIDLVRRVIASKDPDYYCTSFSYALCHKDLPANFKYNVLMALLSAKDKNGEPLVNRFDTYLEMDVLAWILWAANVHQPESLELGRVRKLVDCIINLRFTDHRPVYTPIRGFPHILSLSIFLNDPAIVASLVGLKNIDGNPVVDVNGVLPWKTPKKPLDSVDKNTKPEIVKILTEAGATRSEASLVSHGKDNPFIHFVATEQKSLFQEIDRYPDNKQNQSKTAVINQLKKEAKSCQENKVNELRSKFDEFKKFDRYAQYIYSIRGKYTGGTKRRITEIDKLEQLTDSLYQKYDGGKSIEELITKINSVRETVFCDHKRNGALSCFGIFQPPSRLVKILDDTIKQIQIQLEAKSTSPVLLFNKQT